jgi:hypothetical protein
LHITITRTGGHGADEEVAALDTDMLAPTRAREIEQLIHELDFFNLPEVLPGGAGSDPVRYEVTVAEGERRHTVSYPEDEGPDGQPLQQLVEALNP